MHAPGVAPPHGRSQRCCLLPSATPTSGTTLRRACLLGRGSFSQLPRGKHDFLVEQIIPGEHGFFLPPHLLDAGVQRGLDAAVALDGTQLGPRAQLALPHRAQQVCM